jgi:hypothetical protein
LISQSPLDQYIDNKKAQSLNFESQTHEAQLEDQNPRKRSRRSSRGRKNRKVSKWHKKWQTEQNGKEEVRKAQNYKNSQNSLRNNSP